MLTVILKGGSGEVSHSGRTCVCLHVAPRPQQQLKCPVTSTDTEDFFFTASAALSKLLSFIAECGHEKTSCASQSFTKERQAEQRKTKQGIVSCQMSNFGRDPNISLLSQHWLTKAFVQFVFQTQQKLKWGRQTGCPSLNRRQGGGGGGGGGGRRVGRNFRSLRSLMKWGRWGQTL